MGTVTWKLTTTALSANRLRFARMRVSVWGGGRMFASTAGACLVGKTDIGKSSDFVENGWEPQSVKEGGSLLYWRENHAGSRASMVLPIIQH